VLGGRQGDPNRSPFAAFQLDSAGEIDGLTFNSNTVKDIDGNALSFAGPASQVAITSNIFRRIGQDGSDLRGVVFAGDLTGVTFLANTGDASDVNYVLRAANSGVVWTNVIAQFNTLDGDLGFAGPAFTDGGGNNIQS